MPTQMAKQHRRDHRHHAEHRRARRAAAHPHHDGAGGGPEPGGPLMMTRNRGLMTAIAAVLVLGLIALGIVWALAWA
jgi:hypothetical protein